MPPGSATPSSRTAMLIPSPKRSPSAATITSPRLTPMRSLRELWPDAMLSCISTAHRTAADGLANSAQRAIPRGLDQSPVVAGEARLDYFALQPLELGVGRLLSALHQRRVTDHVSGQDRR